MMSSNCTIYNLLIAILYRLLKSRVSKASIVCAILIDSDATRVSMSFERSLCQECFIQRKILHECNKNIVWVVIDKNSCAPDTEICKEACHLRYQTWLSGDHLINANTFSRCIIGWLSDWALFSFQISWFTMSRAKHARHTNQKPVLEFSKFSVEFPFFGQSDHRWKREMVHLVM